MSVIEELPRSRERFDAVSAARWVLIVVIVLGTLIVWWTTPRTSSVEQLSLDLQDGKVSWIDTDCRPEGGDGLVGFTVVSRPDFVDDDIGQPNAGRDVCWRTTWGQTYAADADELNRDVVRAAKAQFGGPQRSDALTPALRQTAADLAPGDGPEVVEEFSDATGPIRNWAIGITGVCVVGLIILMIAWQQPRRGTRWGWFWIMITASGLGAIVYLIFEAPWNRKAIAMP